MVFVGILIILFILALVSADKIATLINSQISKTKEKKNAVEKHKQERIAATERMQQRIQKLFSKRKRLSVSNAVDELIKSWNIPDANSFPSIQEGNTVEGNTEQYTIVKQHIKENLRGPLLGSIYMDEDDNLVHPSWQDEHSIYTKK